MRVVVVGGTGFLGLNIVEAFREAGAHVVATHRASSNTIFLRRLKVDRTTISLADPDSVARAFDGAEIVCFAAGHYPRFSTNTEAHVARGVGDLRTALEAAQRAGVARFIYTGTVATVGAAPRGRFATEADGTAEIPDGSTYTAVKIAMEREIARASAAGLDVVTLLPSACVGPFDHKVGTGFFLVGLASGHMDAFVDGDINVVDARDVALAHVAAAKRGRRGERYILGGTNIRAGALFHHVAKVLEVPPPERELTPDEALAFAIAEETRAAALRPPGRPRLSREMVDLIVHGQFVDNAKAARELGHVTRPLDDTLATAIGWYRANGYLKRRI